MVKIVNRPLTDIHNRDFITGKKLKDFWSPIYDEKQKQQQKEWQKKIENAIDWKIHVDWHTPLVETEGVPWATYRDYDM